MSKKQDDDKKVKVGSIVKVEIAPYRFFRGIVTNIDGMNTTIEVPTFYGNGDKIIITQDYDTLKLAEPNKKQRR